MTASDIQEADALIEAAWRARVKELENTLKAIDHIMAGFMKHLEQDKPVCEHNLIRLCLISMLTGGRFVEFFNKSEDAEIKKYLGEQYERVRKLIKEGRV